MNTAETKAELTDPALESAGCGVVDGSRVRRKVIIGGSQQFTDSAPRLRMTGQ